MTAIKSKLTLITSAVISAVLLQACEGGSEEGGSTDQVGVNGTYLHISAPDFYFGTKEVGSRATQRIQIANRGADLYPLKSLSIAGENSEEFLADVIDDIVLEPAQAITVGITFQPITNGRKFASFIVDYDTIRQVSDAVNINEQNYYQALDMEKSGNYPSARKLYSDYIAGDPVTVNKRKAAIKLPVVQEANTYGGGHDFELYMRALDLRESGQYDAAQMELVAVQNLYGDGYVGDDSLYLQGYIQLMDQKDYASALTTMQQLRKQYPDSAYYDTALYSEAVAQQELGKLNIAREILLDLRYRHTGLDALGIALPKDNVVSRLWFQRADTALSALESI